VAGVSAVGGRLAVGVGVDDNAAQPASRIVAINAKDILIIVFSRNKYKGKATRSLKLCVWATWVERSILSGWITPFDVPIETAETERFPLPLTIFANPGLLHQRDLPVKDTTVRKVI
jgi:hypothetical protein